MKNNQIESIEPFAFADTATSGQSELNLAGNRLTRVDLADFGRFGRINLSSNQLESIVSSPRMPQISELNLANNRLDNFETFYAQLTNRLSNLQTLNLSHNKFTRIEFEFDLNYSADSTDLGKKEKQFQN